MANEINVRIASEEDVSRALQGIGNQTVTTSSVIVRSMGDSEDAFDTAARSTGKLGSGLDMLSGSTSQLAGGVGDLGDGLQSITDIQKAGAIRASEQARKLLDVDQAMQDARQAARDLEQAQLDLNQAQTDSKQAALDAEQAQADAEQALIDAAQAQKDYNNAVKEHGPKSLEAAQAAQDLKQAQLDLKQANVDAEQALNDQKQATEDAHQAQEDMKQSTIDAKGAQIDLNDAQREAKPPTEIQQWGQNLSLIAPLITGVVGAIDLLILANTALTASFVKNTAAAVANKIAQGASAIATGVMTAAQWLLNAAFWANPLTWIIAGILLLIGVIVLIATKTTWFQDIWNASWGFIKEVAAAVWNFIVLQVTSSWNQIKGATSAVIDWIVSAFNWVVKQVTAHWNALLALPEKLRSVFSKIADFVSAPFKAGFNAVSRAWNSTVGKLSWTVPSWVPGFGGNSISAPKLPTLHVGGEVMRTGAAILRQGERVLPATTRGLTRDSFGPSGGDRQVVFTFRGDSNSLIAQLIMRLIREGYITIDSKAIV